MELLFQLRYGSLHAPLRADRGAGRQDLPDGRRGGGRGLPGDRRPRQGGLRLPGRRLGGRGARGGPVGGLSGGDCRDLGGGGQQAGGERAG